MSRKNELLMISEAYAKVNEGLDGRGDETTTVNDGPGESLELQPNSEGKLYYPGDPSNPDNNKQHENAVNHKSKFIMVDLYTGRVDYVPAGEEREAVMGLQKAKGSKLPAWKGEEYMVIKVD